MSHPRMGNPALNLRFPDMRRLGPPVHNVDRRYPAPPELNPLSIFQPMLNASEFASPRWVKLDNALYGTQHAVLVYVDGAAPSNGQPGVRAGCGIVVRPDGRGNVSFPLERVGGVALTSNRAELRAAHAALRLRDWRAEGFGKIVIASDSSYVVCGISEWVYNWKINGWKNLSGGPISNKDLWYMLVEAVEELEHSGVEVQFYRIHRRHNLADWPAKQGANIDEVPTQWKQIVAPETL